MLQPDYQFTPFLRLGQWKISASKTSQAKPPCEDAVIKKIRSVLSKFQRTQKIISVELQGNLLTVTVDNNQKFQTQIQPEELIHQILGQMGPDHPKRAMTKYKELTPLIARLENNLPKETVISTYNKIKTAFTQIEHDQTAVAWAQKADLMDAIDLLVERFQSEYPDIQLLEVCPSTHTTGPTTDGDVPLVPYHKHRDLGEGEYADIARMKEALKDVLVFENTGMAGKAIQFLTKQRKVKMTAYVFGLLYRILTRLIGWMYSRPSRIQSPLFGIVRAARSMGIRPLEILAKETGDPEGTKFYYRGPRHLFGRSIHEFTSVDDFFRRDLTDAARKEYLAKVQTAEAHLEKTYGPSFQRASRIAISNADCRVRVRELSDFSAPQEIVGKVVTDEEAQEAAKEDPTYYLGTYAFTTKQLLGLDPKQELTAQPLPDKATTADAQKELLAGMARLFQEEGAIQVVQRLAPADIHNYTAPVNGTPLSQEKAAEILKKRAVTRQNKDEVAVFESLSTLLMKDRTTIDIYGGLIGNESVQTGAVTNKPSILAQNDRKVMLFQHDDGSLSLHVFIGATGVNRVSVNQESIHMEQGRQQGDMGFGEEPSTGKLRQGARQGRFDKEGSTVISYYLPADFTPLDSVKKAASVGYEQTVQRKNSSGIVGPQTIRKEVEVLCQMGDPLLVKTEIAMVEKLEKVLGQEEFTNCNSAEQVFETFLQNTSSKQDSLYLFLNKKQETLTWSEQQLQERLQHTVNERLKILLPEKQRNDDILPIEGIHLAQKIFGDL